MVNLYTPKERTQGLYRKYSYTTITVLVSISKFHPYPMKNICEHLKIPLVLLTVNYLIKIFLKSTNLKGKYERD